MQEKYIKCDGTSPGYDDLSYDNVEMPHDDMKVKVTRDGHETVIDIPAADDSSLHSVPPRYLPSDREAELHDTEEVDVAFCHESIERRTGSKIVVHQSGVDVPVRTYTIPAYNTYSAVISVSIIYLDSLRLAYMNALLSIY